MAKPSKPKHRSPNAPIFSLEEAIDRAKKVYERERRHPASYAAICAAWGASPASSGPKQAVGALRRFGLLADSGSDGGRISDLAVKLMLGERGSREWLDAAKKAALSPNVHATMWNRYGGVLPSDASMRVYLVTELGFSEDAAADFLKQYRRTLAFARLDGIEHDGDSSVPAAEGGAGAMPDTTAQLQEQQPTPATPTSVSPPSAEPEPTSAPTQARVSGQREDLRLPLFQGAATLTVSWSRPLTKGEWADMVAALTALGRVNAVGEDQPRRGRKIVREAEAE